MATIARARSLTQIGSSSGHPDQVLTPRTDGSSVGETYTIIYVENVHSFNVICLVTQLILWS